MHEKSLKKHMKYECQKEPTFLCSYCPYKSKTKGNLKIHVNGEILRNLLVGLVTGLTNIKNLFKNTSGSNVVPNKRSPINSLLILYRSRNFRSNWGRGLNLDFLLGKFTCRTCGRTYRHRESLQKHIRFECQKEPTFGCPYCPYKAKRKGNLKVHINGVHLKLRRSRSAKPFCQVFVNDRKFKCQTCDRTYRHRESLHKHVKYECQKEPTFSCPQCPYKAKRRGTLKIHYNRIHLKSQWNPVVDGVWRFEHRLTLVIGEERPPPFKHLVWQCNRCKKCYKNQNTLNVHQAFDCGKDKVTHLQVSEMSKSIQTQNFLE
ncbi:hypothetical protein BDFB_000071 [Asbolus verrucosus]|uniref:C2H2-type domain-containing protein n=1 Tax=Asbolus verrucosus TaxID=1661398 RepID=A0A482V7L1_ASBVE|nr:hypothetical protein BDFB_000071 [Asbolus verrucosus]